VFAKIATLALQLLEDNYTFNNKNVILILPLLEGNSKTSAVVKLPL